MVCVTFWQEKVQNTFANIILSVKAFKATIEHSSPDSGTKIYNRGVRKYH